MKLGRWSTTAASNNTTPPDGWPEGQAPSTVNDCAREMMASIRAAFSDLQFFDQDFTPTYVSATSFTIPGDQTSAIHAGRRLKLYDATAGVATTIYATVATASFTVVTTVSVANDAGQLTSSLSSFAIAILSNNNSSLPRNPSADRFSASAIETTTLTVSGAAVIKGALTVSGACVIAGALSVSGAATFAGTITASGAVTLNTTLTVSGATVLQGALSVGGVATFGTNSLFSGTLAAITILGAGVAGDLSINGRSNFGQFNINGNGIEMRWGTNFILVDSVNLTFGGSSTAMATMDVATGKFNMPALSVSGTVAMGSTLTVSGAAVIKGNLSLGGTLIVASTIKAGPVTVASLPAAAVAGSGARLFVTDASAATFGASASGGGANNVPVFSNGVSWLIG